MKLKYLILILVGCLFLANVHAQDEDSPYSYELHGGINFNTNGGVIGGLSGRFSRKVSKYSLQTFAFDIVEVKHLKEQRTSSLQTGQVFIFGKQNHLFSIRPQYGREIIIFQKYPEEGIRLSAVFSGGPSFGFIKPYYVEYNVSNNDTSDIKLIPFTEELSPSKVLSGGFPLKGFGEMKIEMGFNFKLGLNFEFGKKNRYPGEEVRLPQSISGIETGFSFEKFANEIPILGFAKNKSTYTAVYVTIYYGKRW